VDRRENTAQVVVEVERNDGSHHARPHRQTLVTRVPAPKPLVGREARREKLERGAAPPPFFDGIEGPYIPESDVSPIWNPEFFGNMMVVNGRSWPRLVTERRRYRFRLLNGCDSRFLILKFDDPRVKVWQIGTEGGFLPRPIDLEDVADGQILLAWRSVDVIADFSGAPGNEVHLLNRR
jgi:FtsP/CotA-like multicopper oxidase with cupredoxin domain